MAIISPEKNETNRKYLSPHNTYNKITANINSRLKVNIFTTTFTTHMLIKTRIDP